MSAPQIMRTWRGWTRRTDAKEYEDYLLKTGFREYTATEGNEGVYLTRRDDADRTEFYVISLWASWEAVKAFAGDDPKVAVFYPEDDHFLVDKELTVDHYDIFKTS